MFAPKTLFWIIFPGLLLAVLLGSWFMVGGVPLWLMAAVVVQLLWLAFGQVRRMSVALTGESLQTESAGGERPVGFPDWNYWLRQLFIFWLLLVVAVLGQALWLIAKYELPFDLAWKRPLQRISVLAVPLPERVLIPAGKFQMGERGDSREVTIDYSFTMGKYEVTFAEFDQFVVAMREARIGFQNGPDAEELMPYPFPEDEGWGRGARPVINVSWYQAQDYVNWLSHEIGLQCRLPSEAEWEYAARAGTTTAYWWGDEASHNYANYGTDECCEGLSEGKDQWANTAPVGQFPANPFGLHDMHGNIWEWVQDLYANYATAPANGAAQEVAEDLPRVLRGGSGDITPESLRSATRTRTSPGLWENFSGFRIVCLPIKL